VKWTIEEEIELESTTNPGFGNGDGVEERVLEKMSLS